jgi:hypothetical protein
MNARSLSALVRVRPLTLPPRGARTTLPSLAGPDQEVPYVAEQIQGFELFREGDDPRKLDHRLTEFVGADVARTYEEPRLDPVLVVADLSETVRALAEVERAVRFVTAALCLALVRGGHPVEFAGTGGGGMRAARATPPDHAARLLAEAPEREHGKRGVAGWIGGARAARRTFGRGVLVTDAAWPLRSFERVLAGLTPLAGAAHVLALTREEEYREVSSYAVRAPGAGASRAASVGASRALSRHLSLLGRAAERTGRASLTVVRWDDDRRFPGRLVAALPDLLA